MANRQGSTPSSQRMILNGNQRCSPSVLVHICLESAFLFLPAYMMPGSMGCQTGSTDANKCWPYSNLSLACNWNSDIFVQSDVLFVVELHGFHHLDVRLAMANASLSREVIGSRMSATLAARSMVVHAKDRSAVVDADADADAEWRLGFTVGRTRSGYAPRQALLTP